MSFAIGSVLGVSFDYGLFNRNPFDTVMGVTLGTVLGVTGGHSQWVVLRERIAGAGWWEVAGALGFGLAIGAIVLGLTSGAGYGAITGTALAWLLKQSASGNVEDLATAHQD